MQRFVIKWNQIISFYGIFKQPSIKWHKKNTQVISVHTVGTIINTSYLNRYYNKRPLQGHHCVLQPSSKFNFVDCGCILKIFFTIVIILQMDCYSSCVYGFTFQDYFVKLPFALYFCAVTFWCCFNCYFYTMLWSEESRYITLDDCECSSCYISAGNPANANNLVAVHFCVTFLAGGTAWNIPHVQLCG